ncbi:MAG: nucleotidyltransferase family protein [Candidatus Kapaibacterium sp.]|nr:MAG: nucleotidyltransferase family protein [Candidatus Kapabacteria bacterium]
MLHTADFDRKSILCSSLACIVLAAGESSRMGGENKLLLPLQSSTVLGTTLSLYAAVGFGKIICVTGRDHRQTQYIAEQEGIQTLYNPDFMRGMAYSMRTGVQSIAEHEYEGILIALGDMPFCSRASIYQLCSTFLSAPKNAICVPYFEEQRGNPVLFSIAYKQDLLLLTGDVGAKSLLKKYQQYCIRVEMQDNGCVRDIDTNEDWQNAQRK